MFLTSLSLSCVALASQVGGGNMERYSISQEGEAHYGGAMDSIRDLNGDGVQDVVVGAFDESTVNGWHSGAAYVLSGVDGTVLIRVVGEARSDQFGLSVAGLDDLDGDGLADFVVGAPGRDPGGMDSAGSLYFFFGADGSLIQRLDSPMALARFGWSVANAGDVDGDGTGDIITGTPYLFGRNGVMSGGAFLLSGVDQSRIIRLHPTSILSLFGAVVDGLGDVDGDGIGDVAVGIPNQYGQGGAVRVYSGATGLLIHDFTRSYSSMHFCSAVSGIGDLDRDGHNDILIGSEVQDRFGQVTGGVDVYSGATGAVLFEDIHRGLADTGFGTRLAAVGDLNGDGVQDFAVGAPSASPGGIFEAGSAFLYSGSSGALLYAYHGIQPGGKLGSAIAGSRNPEGRWQGFLIGAQLLDSVGGVNAGGVLRASYRPFLSISSTTVSRTTGDHLLLHLNFPEEDAGHPYGLLMSNNGDSASIFQGFDIHLVQDRSFQRMATRRYPPGMRHGSGFLDVDGHATAKFIVPPLAPAGLIGTTRWFAAVNYELGGSQVRRVSATVPLTILP